MPACSSVLRWVERGAAAYLDCLGCIFVLWVPLAKRGFLGNKKPELLGTGVGESG